MWHFAEKYFIVMRLKNREHMDVLKCTESLFPLCLKSHGGLLAARRLISLHTLHMRHIAGNINMCHSF